MSSFNYARRATSVVNIGSTPLGGDNPIRIQSMANVSTMDTEAAVSQAIRMIDAGAEYLRFTAQGEREAANLHNIRQALNAAGYACVPLVADIHFNPRAADEAALHVEKVRINPGNYVDRARRFEEINYTDEAYSAELQKIRHRLIPFLRLCRTHKTAIRIGVNHGSLSDRIMSRYGDTPEGMVESCMEFLRICVEEEFHDAVISIKASNTVVMIRTVRLLVRTMESEGMSFPLHLGVTEAGNDEDGRIKSALGIGTLLAEGTGDTIRVSLSEEPENEIPVARKILEHIASMKGHKHIDAPVSKKFEASSYSRRKTRCAGGVIGGEIPPIVMLFDKDSGRCEAPASYEDKALRPDLFFHPSENPSSFGIQHFNLTCEDMDDAIIHQLKSVANAVVILSSHHANPVGEMRAAMHRLVEADCDVPVILRRDYSETDPERLLIKASIDFGALLTDGFGDGIMLTNTVSDCCDTPTLISCMYGILQAARVRTSRTEYISCPGCGRTLFDLQTTISRIKSATAHLKGLKIGVMGCIVNGPGEMADADYGYVGSGRGRIDLYKGKECVLRNIPETEAVEKLILLIADK